MTIIKNAFCEGRNTKTPWRDSKAKQNEIKINIAMENHAMMRNRNVGLPLKLARICPDSGDTLQIYLSRLEAAKWIVSNVLENKNTNPVHVTGNMEMCMIAGWKSYGYYWKIIEDEPTDCKPGAQKVYVRLSTSEHVFNSIEEATNYINGVSSETITSNALRKRLKGDKIITIPCGTKNLVVQRYNPVGKVIEFENKTKCREFLKISSSNVWEKNKDRLMWNNYKISIKT